ncbi:MAG: orotidine-5'-phosphate decarboxylase [Flavobacteriales bacterium]|nr:orotidine-5'-phosphate decarboxylase [Flavobacteriales bacterium]|tara:strand:- start:7098 stop:7925 length:828 start_codon:yes stop_codon:yes gene_type:complete
MNKQKLIEQIKLKKSFLCIGLDTDINKIPKHLLQYEDPVFEFNKSIIDATKDFCVAYKPNIAFYESMGKQGWLSLQKTIDYIPSNILTIADAKRGDIGNTSKMYARSYFDNLKFDCITLSPFMGFDSISPYLNYKDKWVILLALTSNQGSLDFQNTKLANGLHLFEEIIRVSKKWGSSKNMMYVVGATKATRIKEIRKIIPNHFLLIPGVGKQGGSLYEVAQYGLNSECGILINSSRSIIYASNCASFAENAKIESKKIQQNMSNLLSDLGFLEK